MLLDPHQPSSEAAKKMMPTSGTHKRKSPGVVALKEIKKYKLKKRLAHDVNMLMRKGPFRRLVSHISKGHAPGFKWNTMAIDILQQASEDYIVGIFEEAVLEAIQHKRLTLMPKDIQHVLRNRLLSDDLEVPFAG